MKKYLLKHFIFYIKKNERWKLISYKNIKIIEIKKVVVLFCIINIVKN